MNEILMRVKVVKDLPSKYRLRNGGIYTVVQTLIEDLVNLNDSNNWTAVCIEKTFLRELIAEGFLEEIKEQKEIAFYVNIYLHKDGKYEVGMPCDTEEKAKNQIVLSPLYLETKKCTIKIGQ